MLGLAEVPVIVREADDRAALELALIENLQRENLNPIEEAGGYAQLIGQFNLTQEQAAAKVGKSRVVIAKRPAPPETPRRFAGPFAPGRSPSATPRSCSASLRPRSSGWRRTAS